jgi:hypothetical protein
MQHTPCQRCGATVPVPTALETLVMRCNYCGNEQPVPDMVERHKMIDQRRREQERHALQQEHTKQVQGQVKNVNRVIFAIVGAFIFFILVAVAIAIVKIMLED